MAEVNLQRKPCRPSAAPEKRRVLRRNTGQRGGGGAASGRVTSSADRRRGEALLAFRQALGSESDAIALPLRLPSSYDDPDATPDRPINLQQQNAFAAYRNTVRMT